jgi:uncharacterized protein
MVACRGAQAWLPEMLARMTAASGIGYLAAAYTVSRWLTKPSPGKVTRTPSDFDWTWEPLTCRTSDGFRLAGWVVAPARPRATIALFHGARSNREQTLPRLAFLARAGYRCVAFDHRAHGESEGRRMSFGYYEGRDVAAIRALIGDRWPNEPHAALGISMGAAAVCFGGHGRGRFEAIVLESLYRDIASAFANRLRTTYPPWLSRFGPGIIATTERRLGIRLAELAPARQIAQLAPAPILLLTGTSDPHAPPAETKQLFDCYPGPRELWFVPQAGHKDVFEVGGLPYQERVLEFLERWLPR